MSVVRRSRLKSNQFAYLTASAFWVPILFHITPNALAAQSSPASMTVSVGTYNGSVADLVNASEGRVVNLYTNRKGNLTATFKISASQLSSNLILNARFLQFTGTDTFAYQVLNSTGYYTTVGSTSGASNTYKSLSYPLPAGSVVNGVVTIRLISSAGAGDCNLDFLSVADSGVSPSPSPSTSPKPSPSPSPSTSPSPSPSPSPTPTSSSSALSIPAGTKWYWQLQGTVNTGVAAKVYDIDLYDNSASTFSALKQSGHTVICYFSAGTWENWRPDANLFPASALGSNVSGWQGEKWLDVRDSTVRSIMAQRMDLAKSKGCDGLEPDNVDGYSNKSGFPLTMQDQINFNTFLADQAHARGMIVALKNSTDLVSSLVSKFDFAVVEECFRYNECSAYTPFISEGKAVLNAEYTSYSSSVCSQAASLKFSTVFYNLNLDGTVYNPCP
jgi:hypothetical protein